MGNDLGKNIYMFCDIFCSEIRLVVYTQLEIPECTFKDRLMVRQLGLIKTNCVYVMEFKIIHS